MSVRGSGVGTAGRGHSIIKIFTNDIKAIVTRNRLEVRVAGNIVPLGAVAEASTIPWLALSALCGGQRGRENRKRAGRELRWSSHILLKKARSPRGVQDGQGVSPRERSPCLSSDR